MGPWLAVFLSLVFDLSTNEIQSFQNIMIRGGDFIVFMFYCVVVKKLVGPIFL